MGKRISDKLNPSRSNWIILPEGMKKDFDLQSIEQDVLSGSTVEWVKKSRDEPSKELPMQIAEFLPRPYSRQRLKVVDLSALAEIFSTAIDDISTALGLSPEEFKRKVEMGEIEGEIECFRRLAKQGKMIKAISTVPMSKAVMQIEKIRELK